MLSVPQQIAMHRWLGERQEVSFLLATYSKVEQDHRDALLRQS
jgi:hypothetical protein